MYFERSEDAELARATLIKRKGNVSFAKKEKDASERHSKHSVGFLSLAECSSPRGTSGWAT